ncbi:hypothetical protein Cob_v000904 [Colletotrichum orbiculare MAFF 240422]|uniref:Uncharacterized protein n=1 Tax=Colletotrichum orbiculare (strain 104-T / ATCC 96160 / CBS 514.97 / LARS 414 / MAFF 240422) TaxID=1213857 RepID=A0A484G6A7_COLOR|nr:hypothetical protein Cob_v000904 [Colletotrichum orbiculare MAFF 240422]
MSRAGAGAKCRPEVTSGQVNSRTLSNYPRDYKGPTAAEPAIAWHSRPVKSSSAGRFHSEKDAVAAPDGTSPARPTIIHVGAPRLGNNISSRQKCGRKREREREK